MDPQISAASAKPGRPVSTAATTLEELVAPLTEAEFLGFLRERKVVHLRSANDGCYVPLAGWEALRRLIEHGEYPRGDYFKVTKESKLAPTRCWMSNGKVDTDRLEQCLADGFSIIVTHIEEELPALRALCQSISVRLQETSYAGVVVSSGAEGAFRTHYDVEDLVILQVEGAKRWQMFGPPVSNPVRGMAAQSPPPGPPCFDEVLQPGDLLFVPAGHWHHCQTMSGKSIHLAIFLYAPTSWHATKALTSQLLTDELFRAPLTRVGDVTQLEALEAEVKRRLIEKIGALRLREFPASVLPPEYLGNGS